MRSPAVRHALARRVRALDRDLSAALEDDVEALHRARVASRRLREILPVLGLGRAAGRQAPIRKLRRRLRRLTAALGGVRELDVALGILDEMIERRPDLSGALSAAREVVEADREESRADMVRQVEEIRAGALVEQLTGLLDAAARPSGATRSELLGRRLGRRADRFEAAVSDAGSVFVLDRLHRVRIAAKQFRYALELAHEVGHVPALRLVARLKRIQDLLGRLHDLEVVGGYLQPQAGAAGPSPDAEARALVEQEMRQLHAVYLARAGTLGAIVSACRGKVLPGLADRAVDPTRRRVTWPRRSASTSSGTRSPRSRARSTRTTRSGR